MLFEHLAMYLLGTKVGFTTKKIETFCSLYEALFGRFHKLAGMVGSKSLDGLLSSSSIHRLKSMLGEMREAKLVYFCLFFLFSFL